MRTWLTNLWDGLRSGFWFLPAAIIAAGMLLGLLLLTVDAQLDATTVLPKWVTSSAPAARTILSALAGALLTGTSVVFSITMLVLAQTASQFGSRLLRTIADGNVAQTTLGLFLATSVYCLLVLRTVREDEFGAFVPHVSVAAGVLLGLLSLCALIYFLNDTASSIQAQTVVRAVYDDLEDAIERLFPSPIGGAPDDGTKSPDVPVDPPDDDRAAAIEATWTGYLQAIDGDTLLATAVAHDLVVHVVVPPGAFLTTETVVARVEPADRVDDEGRRSLERCFLLGNRRTPRQDVICAVDELVEVAVRSLSPGINDPFTALTCVDYLGAGLVALTQRGPADPVRVDEEGHVRVVTRPPGFEQVLDAAVEMLARHACRTASVVVRLLEMLERVAARVVRESDANAIRDRAEWIGRLAEDEFEEREVRDAVAVLQRSIRDRLESRISSNAETEVSS